MKLENLRDLTYTDLTDDDILPVFHVLWDMKDKESEKDLKERMTRVLVDDEDFSLSTAIKNLIENHLREFRDKLAFEETQVPVEGKRTLALVEFGHHHLNLPYHFMIRLLNQAEKEGSERAPYLLARIVVNDKALSKKEKWKAALQAAEKIGWKMAGDLVYFAHDTSNGHGFDYLKKGADEGNVNCAAMCALYLEGYGKYKESVLYWELGKKTSNPNFQFFYAMTFISDLYGRVDMKRGEQLLIKAALSGSSDAAGHLGKSYLWGKVYSNGKIDYVKAEKYLRMADEYGHEDAGYFLGCLYFGSYDGEPKWLIDHKKAVSLWERFAKGGDAEAMAQIGCFYYNGIEGYQKNKDMAASYYRQSAMGGSIEGYINYGEMIRDKETPETLERMIMCFTNAMSSDSKSQRDRAKEAFAEAFEEGSKITEPNLALAEKIRNLKIEWQETYTDTNKRVWEELKKILPSELVPVMK